MHILAVPPRNMGDASGVKRAAFVAAPLGIAAVVSVVACAGRPTPSPESPELISPHIHQKYEPSPVQPSPPPVAVATCPITVRVESRTVGGSRIELTAIAEGGEADYVLELEDRCPNGLVGFEGLGAGYDYYGTCAKGACPGGRSAQRIRIGSHQRVPLSTTTIDPLTETACTKPLAKGRYIVRSVLPEGAQACIVPSVIEIGGELPPARPTMPMIPSAPAPAPPMPPPPAAPPAHLSPKGTGPADLYACESPADCVLSCPKVSGCCSSACGCKHAINRAHKATYETNYAKTCRKPPACPAEGCAFESAVSATCRAGRCVAVSGLGF